MSKHWETVFICNASRPAFPSRKWRKRPGFQCGWCESGNATTHAPTNIIGRFWHSYCVWIPDFQQIWFQRQSSVLGVTRFFVNEQASSAKRVSVFVWFGFIRLVSLPDDVSAFQSREKRDPVPRVFCGRCGQLAKPIGHPPPLDSQKTVWRKARGSFTANHTYSSAGKATAVQTKGTGHHPRAAHACRRPACVPADAGSPTA